MCLDDILWVYVSADFLEYCPENGWIMASQVFAFYIVVF